MTGALLTIIDGRPESLREAARRLGDEEGALVARAIDAAAKAILADCGVLEWDACDDESRESTRQSACAAVVAIIDSLNADAQALRSQRLTNHRPPAFPHGEFNALAAMVRTKAADLLRTAYNSEYTPPPPPRPAL